MKKRHEQKLIVVSLVLLVCLNIPILLIFNKTGSVFGLPVLYFYVFFVWALSIIISYILLKKHYE
ncbi:MAG: hypothetical protein COB98_06065 [Flavobacteriaceae bacterium]|nr:MAG: hypothetical protein COB98_06065 [Flavobacteriaceae bacterium]